MKQYEILPDVFVKLNKVTPRAIKFYKENNFFEDRFQQNGEFLELLLNKELVSKWCDVLFVLDKVNSDLVEVCFEDISFNAVFEAHWDFFLLLSPSFKKLMSSKTNS